MEKLQRPAGESEKLLDRLWRIIGGDRLFFCSYVIFLAFSILSTSFFYRYIGGYAFMWIQIFCVLLLGAYELRNGAFKAQNWIAGPIAAFLALIALRVSEGSLHRMVMLMIVYIYCARRIPFAKIARVTLQVSIVTCLAVVLGSELGLIERIVSLHKGRVRHYLGFRYALYPAGILLNMTALWVYLKKDTITLPKTLAWAAVNFVVFYLTDSRTSFVIAEAILLGTLVIRYCPKLTKKLQPVWFLAVISFVVFAAISVAVVLAYDSVPQLEWIDNALSGRISHAKESLDTYGVSLFGQKIEWIGNGLDLDGVEPVGAYNYVDCLYLKIPQRYGLVFSVIVLALVTWGMFRMWKRREYQILLISALVAAHCVLDDLSFNLHYNTFWLALGLVLMDQTKLNWNGKTTQLAPPAEPEEASPEEE